MTLDTFLSLILGILGGLYSGLIVARITVFEALRTEVKRVILEINFIVGDSPPNFSGEQRLTMAASDLLAKGHQQAGLGVLSLNKEILNALLVKNVPPELIEQYSKWQRVCAELKPNMKVILSLRPWL